MTIKELADKLQIEIDDKMEAFNVLGKEAKKLGQKIEKIHQQMGKLLQDLEPVDSLIRAQHPEKVQLFDALLAKAKKENE